MDVGSRMVAIYGKCRIHDDIEAHFRQGVKANVQLKLNIPIGAKVEIRPKGLTIGVKAEIEKVF